MNHFKKKNTILIFFSIVFDNWSVSILTDFVKYFWSQFSFFLITNWQKQCFIEGLNKVNHEP